VKAKKAAEAEAAAEADSEATAGLSTPGAPTASDPEKISVTQIANF
jgi:hypothetical protein